MHHLKGRLTPLKPSRYLAMLLLALVTAPGGLALAGGGPATASDAFVVGARVVGEGGEDGGVPVLLAALVLGEEGQEKRGDE
jgi:hypothetical protein